MNIRKLSRIALLGGALVTPGYADKVTLEQLPADLQAKIRAQTGGARVEDIDRNVRNGKTTYEVAFKNARGQNTELVLEDTSTVATTPSSTTLDSRKIQYKELPQPVRTAADAQINGGEVNDVERSVRNGRVTYGIGYKGLNGTGPQRELVLDSEGNILRGRRSGATAASTSTPGVTGSPASSASANGIGASSSTRTIAYTDLPQKVRSVAEAHLNKGAVERVERQRSNGNIGYFISFKKEDGEYQQMLIGEEGQILSNQLVSAAAAGASSAAGAAATTQTGVTTSTTNAALPQGSQYSSVRTPVPMKNSSAVDRSQVPAEVRRTVRDAARNGNVEEILQGEWAGKPVYQVTFTDENKKYVELQVDANGQVIYDPRSAAVSTTTTTTTPPANSGGLLQNIGRAILDNSNPK